MNLSTKFALSLPATCTPLLALFALLLVTGCNRKTYTEFPKIPPACTWKTRGSIYVDSNHQFYTCTATEWEPKP